MKEELAVGIVGCGYWGPNLARNLNGDPRASVTALCDLEPARLDRMRDLHPSARLYTNYDRKIEDSDLDAIAIATPVSSHFRLAKAALAAGKHVLVEKPMAASTAECLELVELAERNGLVLMVGHTYLFASAVRKITEIIRDGGIGELRYINCQRLNLGLFQQDINVAWDLAPHDLSIILDLMGGTPVYLNCQGNAHFTSGVEDVTNLSLTFSNHRFATIQSSWLEPRKVRQMTFVGTEKMIVFDDLQPLEKIRIHDVRVERPPHYADFAEFQYSYHYGDCYAPRIEQAEPLKVMCGHFLDCVMEGRTPITCGRRGMELVGILEAASESLRHRGAPVAVDTPPPAGRGRAKSSGATPRTSQA
jgi:predicted dehydrogenase